MTDEERNMAEALLAQLQLIDGCLSLVLGRVKHIKSVVQVSMLQSSEDIPELRQMSNAKMIVELMMTESELLMENIKVVSDVVLQWGQDD